jgi:Ca-activated chloride channel family protein
MNRTTLFLGSAAVLALVALVAYVPRNRGVERPQVDSFPRPDGVTASDGSLTMKARLSHPYVGAARQDVFLTVDLTAKEVAGAARAPLNLALVIDRSGSMSGFKLNQAKLAAKQLVSQLRAVDRLALVHYGSDVKSQAGQQATEEGKRNMLAYIDGIWDDGGTNIGAGVSTGRDLLMSSMAGFKVNRLVLISDGQPTEGMTDTSGLTELVRETRSHGISLSSIGVGSDFNEDLMQALAEVGAGAYAYLNDASQLATIFQKDLHQASTQVASGVTLALELPAGVELGEVLGYRSDVTGKTVRIFLPDFAAGQIERLVARVNVAPGSVGTTLDIAGIDLRYRDLLRDAQVASEARLSAHVTADQAEVARNRDGEATVFAARARSAWNTQQAADALKAGNREEAEKLLQGNAFFFEEAAQVAGPAAVAKDMQEQNDLLHEFQNARDEAAVQHQTKSAKRKARLDYGLMGSTY